MRAIGHRSPHTEPSRIASLLRASVLTPLVFTLLVLPLLALTACGRSQLDPTAGAFGPVAGGFAGSFAGSGAGVAGTSGGTGVAGSGAGSSAGSSAGTGTGFECEHHGVIYQPGDAFLGDDGCSSCVCRVDGLIVCDPKTCNQLTCEYLGSTYLPGSVFAAGDGCNTCTCLFDGEVVCTGVGCAIGCFLGEMFFPPSAEVVCPDGCNTCTCNTFGTFDSTGQFCPPLKAAEACAEMPMPNDGLRVGPLYLSGDALALEVRYAGGCLTHTWKLCYGTVVDEQMLAKVRAWVVDTSGQADPCDAVISESMVFDLSPLGRDNPFRRQILVEVGDSSMYYTH